MFLAAAATLGITVSPIISLVIRAVSSLVVEKIYDLAVPLFGVVIYALLGCNRDNGFVRGKY